MKIVVEKGQRVFFTSDTHYNHTNICRGVSEWDGSRGTRDFNTLYEMNAVLINGINSTVGENDILIHLGDWSFGGFDKIEEFRNQIVCKNIHLILGNHDHHIQNNKEDIQDLFLSVNQYLYLTVVEQAKSKNEPAQKHRFVLSHYPIASWQDMGQGVMHLHGHVHLPKGKRVGPGRMMDVGVDGNDLKPIDLSGVLAIMKKQPVKSMFNFKDHHEDNGR
jgi:calcineurin-like phosphoesterase family protein